MIKISFFIPVKIFIQNFLSFFGMKEREVCRNDLELACTDVALAMAIVTVLKQTNIISEVDFTGTFGRLERALRVILGVRQKLSRSDKDGIAEIEKELEKTKKTISETVLETIEKFNKEKSLPS